MASNPVTNIRIDPDLKDSANAVFEELGITLSTAVNVFLKAVVREGGMPFDMKVRDKACADANGEPQPERERESKKFSQEAVALNGR